MKVIEKKERKKRKRVNQEITTYTPEDPYDNAFPAIKRIPYPV